MRNPGFRGDGDPGGKVVKESNSTRDFIPSLHRSQVVKRRAIGPTWINVVTRRHRYAVPTWRLRSIPLSTGAAR
jgi:hypothetical protein